jgi:ribosomal protein S18 acetylase RimI-like enzyme
MSVLQNLGFQSEFIINQLEATIIEQPDYTVLQTPANPTYYFGNLLALKIPLNTHSHLEWLRIFEGAFSNLPDVKHYTFSWVRPLEQDPTEITTFTDANFKFEETHVLAMKRQEFEPTKVLNEDVILRPLSTEQDWQHWLELSIKENTGDHDEQGLREFLSLQIDNYRRLNSKNLGEYLGAFIDQQLVGYAGLYHRGALARFQNVHVIPDHQNKKIAKTLLTHLIQRTSESVEQLVIIADEHYHATKLYQSLGFKIAERECSLCWWPDAQRKQGKNE